MVIRINRVVWFIGLLVCTLSLTGCEIETSSQPNIIFILSDELSWNDLGCYGQKKISTPNIDRIAYEGIKFTQAYAGNSVCAPSRSCLMEGKHPGHARIRDNSYGSYRESLQRCDTTVAMMLQNAGYVTGLFGKWGLSLINQPGTPDKMGFDDFFGYLNQRHAHCYYPEFLYQNTKRIYFPENGEQPLNYKDQSNYRSDGICEPLGIKEPEKAKYSFDLYSEKALDFIRRNKERPFFLYLAYTIPHGPLIVPDLGEFKNKDWPVGYKEWAAMITRMDKHVGRLLKLLKDEGIDDKTIIFFASDNGYSADGYNRDKSIPTIGEFFEHEPPTRGKKAQAWDGSFRVPAMARWPGHIKPGRESELIWAFWDFMPTAAELANIKIPQSTDGISIVPTLLENGEQKLHEYLYWEFRGDQAVRMNHWFGHRSDGGKVELFHIVNDPEQTYDLSDRYPGIVLRIRNIMKEAHSPSDVWPSPGETRESFQKRIEEKGVPERPENIYLY